MTRGRDKLVTILGSDYFEPIAVLVDRLLQQPWTRPNRINSGGHEAGYSASCVLLLVAMFESYVSRLRFVQAKKVPDSTRTAVDVVLAVFPKLRHRKALLDVYVLRVSLMHGHVWEVDYEWGGPVPLRILDARMHAAFGDKKFKARVNMSTRRTKAIGLSILPSRVDRTDLLKVFETIWKTLLVIEAADRFQCYVSHLHVAYRRKLILFSALHGELKSAA